MTIPRSLAIAGRCLLKQMPRQLAVIPSNSMLFCAPESAPEPVPEAGSGSSGAFTNGTKARIQALVSAKDENNIHKFMTSLLDLATALKRNDETAEAVLVAVAPLIAEMSPFVPMEQHGPWLWCLGKLGFRSSIPEERMLLQRSVGPFLEHIQEVSTESLCRGLKGLQSSRFLLTDFTAEQQTCLLSGVETHLKNVGLPELCKLPGNLGKLGANSTTLPESLIAALWKAIGRHTPNMDHLPASLLLVHLSKLGVRVTDEQQATMINLATKGLRTHVHGQEISFPGQKTEEVLPNMTAKWNTMTINSLAGMGTDFAALPDELKEKLVTCLLDSMPELSDSRLCDVLTALDSMDYSWMALKPELLSALVSRVLSLDLDKLPKSQGKLSAIFSTFPESLVAALWKALAKSTSNMDHPTASLLVARLSELGMPMTDEQQAAVHSIAGRGLRTHVNGQEVLPNMTAQWNLMTISSLAGMGVSLGALPAELKDKLQTCLLDSLSALSHDCICEALISLSSMDHSWMALKPELVTALVYRVLSSNLLPEALYKLNATYSGLPDELKGKMETSLLDSRSELPDSRIHEVLASLNSLDSSWMAFNPELVTALMSRALSSDLHKLPKSLDKLSANYSTMPERLVAAHWKAIAQHISTVDHASASDLLVFLSGHGMRVEMLNDEQLAWLNQLAVKGFQTQDIEVVPPKLTAQWNEKTITSLAGIGVRFAALPDELKDKLEAYLLDSLPALTTKGLYAVLASLDHMGHSWRTFKPALQMATIASVQLRLLGVPGKKQNPHKKLNKGARDFMYKIALSE